MLAYTAATGQFGDDYGGPTTLMLHAVGPAGTPKWPAPFALGSFTWNAIPAVGADGNLYVAGQGAAQCVSGASGTELWSEAVEGSAYGTALGSDGSMYFVSEKGL